MGRFIKGNSEMRKNVDWDSKLMLMEASIKEIFKII